MRCSPEKLAANRENAKKSTGPRTDAGKAISRRNGLKHGLTGAGIVIPGEDVELVAGRFDRLTAELKPRTELGVVLAEQISILSIRLIRCAVSETATLSENVRLAESRSLEARLSMVDELFEGLNTRPYTCARQLEQYPEGIDRLLDLYASVRTDLGHPTLQLFDGYHYQRLDAMEGRTPSDFPATRVKALSQAYLGNCVYLNESEAAIDKMEQSERQAWAKAGLLAIIDERVMILMDRRAELEPQEARARTNLSKAAQVDLSPDAQLARKYESAARREMFRSIREFREVEAEARLSEEAEASDVNDGPADDCDEVASDFLGPITHPRRLASGPAVPEEMTDSDDEPGQNDVQDTSTRSIPGAS